MTSPPSSCVPRPAASERSSVPSCDTEAVRTEDGKPSWSGVREEQLTGLGYTKQARERERTTHMSICFNMPIALG